MREKRSKPLILIVDDTPDNIDVLVGALKAEYEIKAAVNGKRALQIARDNPKPDMILLDVMMPEMDGYEVCRRLKAEPVTSEIPVIFVTALNDAADERYGFDLGAVDYITKPIRPALVQARVQTHLALYDQNREQAKKIALRTEELQRTRLQIIQRLGRAAEYRDNETGFHVIRMSHYSRLIASAYGGNSNWVDLIFNASPMHDVGKIGVPDKILLKPGKLDAEEWRIMQKHTEFGAEIIGDHSTALMTLSRSIALTHHEKWDGSGYPNGLAGEKIPLEGRIVAIADVFDALTSDRVYKKAWKVEDAVGLIEDDSGHHFDPDLVGLFLEVLPDILKIKESYKDRPGVGAGLTA